MDGSPLPDVIVAAPRGADQARYRQSTGNLPAIYRHSSGLLWSAAGQQGPTTQVSDHHMMGD
jgi:hypothetical protein